VKDGTRAAEIISRIRLLFKKGTPDWELVDINEVIREMIVLLRGEATRYNIAVQTDLAADLCQAMGDRVQLQQVMMNLIMNSIDAMKEVEGNGGGYQVGACGRSASSGVGQRYRSGIAPAGGEPDFQCILYDQTGRHRYGTVISRSIVESHGGRLWATSNSGRGATFHLTLPTIVEAHK